LDKLIDKKIIDSWKKNTRPWIKAIERSEIESRRLVTNKVVVDTILTKKPKSVLDIGCGEGWLVRELQKVDIDTLGIDIMPEFIEYASKQNKGRFKCLPYSELNYDNLKEKFDLLVCNFSLLGQESVEAIFNNSHGLLNNQGYFIIQTLHPKMVKTDKSGWQQGSWDGFSTEFCEPAPWYFRNTSDWKELYSSNGFSNLQIIDPINPISHQPASIIFIGQIN